MKKSKTLEDLIDSQEIIFVHESIGGSVITKSNETAFTKRYKKMIHDYCKATIEAVIPKLLSEQAECTEAIYIYNEAIKECQDKGKEWLGDNNDKSKNTG